MEKKVITEHKTMYCFDEKDGYLDERLKEVFYLVEANSHETQKIWEDNEFNISDYTRSTWDTNFVLENKKHHVFEQDMKGYVITIGKVLDEPIVLSIFYYKIDKLLVGFYEATSNLVDHRIVEEWFNIHCNPMYDERRCRCNAQNFHNCLLTITRYNEKNKVRIHRKEIIDKLIS